MAARSRSVAVVSSGAAKCTGGRAIAAEAGIIGVWNFASESGVHIAGFQPPMVTATLLKMVTELAARILARCFRRSVTLETKLSDRYSRVRP